MARSIIIGLSIFAVFFTSMVFFRKPIDGYLFYLVVLALLPIFLVKYNFKIPAKILILYLVLFLVGMAMVIKGHNKFGLFMKSYTSFCFFYVYYFLLLKYMNYDFERIFRVYYKGALIVASIGIIQFISYLADFKPGHDFTWLLNKWGDMNELFAINSIMPEPSHLAQVMGPAMFLSLYTLLKKPIWGIYRWQAILIIIVYLLSGSSTGYAGVLFAFILIFFQKIKLGRLLWGGTLLVIVFVGFYQVFPKFRVRVNGFVAIYATANPGMHQFMQSEGSSFVLYNNLYIAMKAFSQSPLTGAGIGSHPYSFDKYSLTKNGPYQEILRAAFGLNVNRMDASSLLNRLASETGIMGLGFAFWFLYAFFIRRKKAHSIDLWLVNRASLLIIFLFLLRQGHYFLYGFPFFVWMYYYSHRINAQQYKASSS